MNCWSSRARHAASLMSLAGLLLCGCSVTEPPAGDEQPGSRPTLQLGELLSGSAEGFRRAFEPRRFEFPRDHGAHPEFRTEWWYLTGNLAAENGRRFGYQFTLFRNATAHLERRTSRWASGQLYMAHLALTDVEGRRFHALERFSRGALGLAGVDLDPFRAWLEDWELAGETPPPPFHLRAAGGDFALELELGADKPLVLQGDAGLSRKGREPGNASYYYAFTRLATSGRIAIGDLTLEVEGTSWLDREWSTSALEEGQRGWDWFALQLDDGTDLMLYRIRRDDDEADPASSGSLVDRAGAKTPLVWDDVRLEVLDWWTSPVSGARYPSGWELAIPSEQLTLVVEPLLEDQELRLSVLYWEGAVRVDGTRGGAPISGYGYVELTGYDQPPTGDDGTG